MLTKNRVLQLCNLWWVPNNFVLFLPFDFTCDSYVIWKLNKCLIFLKFHPKFDKSREFWYFLCFVALVFISIVYTVPKNHLFWNNVGKVSFKRQLGLLEVYPRTISDNLLILSTFDLKTNTEHNVQSQKQTMRTTKNDRQINWTTCWLSNLCWSSIFYVNRSNCAQKNG